MTPHAPRKLLRCAIYTRNCPAIRGRLIQIVDPMNGSVLPGQALHLIGSRLVREVVGIAPLFGVLGFPRPVDFLGSAIFHPP
jgi:hypothetical protein